MMALFEYCTSDMLGCVHVSPLAHTHVVQFEVTQQLVCHPANHLPRLLLGRPQHRLEVLDQAVLVLQQECSQSLHVHVI